MQAPLRIWLIGVAGSGAACLARELAPALRSRGREARIGIVTAALAPLALPAAEVADIHLVLGLDALPAGEALARAEAADHALRQQLQREGRLFRVVYGSGRDRLERALRAIDAALGETPERHTRWRAACETCSDPDCEHTLFRGLAGAAAP